MKYTGILFAAQLAFAAVNYSYDSAGRLIRADYGSTGAIVYSYDKAGNLLSRAVQSGGAGGVISRVNVAGAPASAGIAQNAWLEIRGSNLVPANTPAEGVIWNSAPEFAQGSMPTQIGSISVTVNGKPAYIYYYCSAVTSSICAQDQINVLSPLDNATGSVDVVVTNGSTASAPFTTNMSAAVPSFLRFSDQGYVVAIHTNGALLGPSTLYPGLSTPASPNETVVVFGVGWGLPTASLTQGSSAQSGLLPSTPVCKIGSTTVAVAAALISPGLYQFNLTIPGDAKGDNSLSCTYNGATTPSGDLLTVQ
ncbi:MAG: hypothetical protein LAO79_16895 [Acidobacteriia bacterium]|nr:hypothetical protein [Terriglobia bacterium]